MTPALDAVRREELRAKALAATPGPWTVGGGWTDHGSRWTGIVVEFGDDVIGESGTASDADWSYIAAMSPDTTLALLAYIAELEVDRETDDRVLRASVPERHKSATSPVGAVQSYIVELEARIAELEATLTNVRRRAKNARGAIESNQVVDKDVRGSMT